MEIMYNNSASDGTEERRKDRYDSYVYIYMYISTRWRKKEMRMENRLR